MLRSMTISTYRRVLSLLCLTRPNIRSLNSQQNFSLLRRDLLHHEIGHQTTKGGADYLHGKCAFRGKMSVLPEFEILEHVLSLI